MVEPHLGLRIRPLLAKVQFEGKCGCFLILEDRRIHGPQEAHGDPTYVRGVTMVTAD